MLIIFFLYKDSTTHLQLIVSYFYVFLCCSSSVATSNLKRPRRCAGTELRSE